MAGPDLAAIAKNAADIAFSIADSALEDATLHLGGTQTYDYDTDKPTTTGGQDVPVRGLFYQEQQSQTEGIINQGVFLIKGADAPNGVFEADTLTRAGVVWNIDRVDPIPTKAVIKLYIRR